MGTYRQTSTRLLLEHLGLSPPLITPEFITAELKKPNSEFSKKFNNAVIYLTAVLDFNNLQQLLEQLHRSYIKAGRAARSHRHRAIATQPESSDEAQLTAEKIDTQITSLIDNINVEYSELNNNIAAQGQLLTEQNRQIEKAHASYNQTIAEALQVAENVDQVVALATDNHGKPLSSTQQEQLKGQIIETAQLVNETSQITQRELSETQFAKTAAGRYILSLLRQKFDTISDDTVKKLEAILNEPASNLFPARELKSEKITQMFSGMLPTPELTILQYQLERILNERRNSYEQFRAGLINSIHTVKLDNLMTKHNLPPVFTLRPTPAFQAKAAELERLFMRARQQLHTDLEYLVQHQAAAKSTLNELQAKEAALHSGIKEKADQIARLLNKQNRNSALPIPEVPAEAIINQTTQTYKSFNI